MRSWYMLIDIIVLPPPHTRKAIGNTGLSINRKKKLLWYVDNKKLFPHVSLYHMNVDGKGLKSIIGELEKILLRVKPFSVSIDGYSGDGKYVGLENRISKDLKNLHRNVVLSLRKYRLTAMPMSNSPSKEVTALQKQNMERYGAKSVMKLYHPHITLGMVREPEDSKDVSNELKKKKFGDFVVNTIAIGKIDKYWQVTKILKEYKLKN